MALLFQSGRSIDLENKGNVFDGKFFPVQAVNWLNQHPQNGHMFNDFDWGGYLLLKLSPRQQIFMDGHTHIYGEKLTREYETVIALEGGWQEILDKYQVKWAIVRTGSPVARALKELHWKIAFKMRLRPFSFILKVNFKQYSVLTKDEQVLKKSLQVIL